MFYSKSLYFICHIFILYLRGVVQDETALGQVSICFFLCFSLITELLKRKMGKENMGTEHGVHTFNPCIGEAGVQISVSARASLVYIGSLVLGQLGLYGKTLSYLVCVHSFCPYYTLLLFVKITQTCKLPSLACPCLTL